MDGIIDRPSPNFDERALKIRSGYAAVNQEFNNGAQRAQSCVNLRNGYWDANMNRVAISTVPVRAPASRGEKYSRTMIG